MPQQQNTRRRDERDKKRTRGALGLQASLQTPARPCDTNWAGRQKKLSSLIPFTQQALCSFLTGASLLSNSWVWEVRPSRVTSTWQQVITRLGAHSPLEPLAPPPGLQHEPHGTAGPGAPDQLKTHPTPRGSGGGSSKAVTARELLRDGLPGELVPAAPQAWRGHTVAIAERIS